MKDTSKPKRPTTLRSALRRIRELEKLLEKHSDWLDRERTRTKFLLERNAVLEEEQRVIRQLINGASRSPYLR